MGQFLVPYDRLDTSELNNGRFLLLRSLWFESTVLGRIIKVAQGFVYDRESVPRWLPITYAWLSGTSNRGGAVHDWLYQTHKVEDVEVSRAVADHVYREAADADGNSWAKRWVKWVGVRLGGASAYASGPSRFTRYRNERRKRRREP